MSSVDTFMRRALDICTEKSKTEGGPIASIVTKDGKIIAEGWNGVLKYNDPTLHAEVDAIRKACSALQSRTLEGCEIYTTLEPCAMCAAAIFYSKIKKVYWASSLSDIKHVVDYSVVNRESGAGAAGRSVPHEQLTSAAGEATHVILEWMKANPDDPFSRGIAM